MYLIAGLGNPGSEYKNTRHNIGFQIIDLLCLELGIRLDNRRFSSRSTRTKLSGKEIILLCPTTFMNLSGKAIKTCMDYYNIDVKNILIINDDLDLPVGRIKVVSQGGSGGHKGVQSVIDYLGSFLFPRMKIGIGRPRNGESTEEYVLSPFYNDHKDIMEKVNRLSVQACKLFLSEGVESVMNHINRKKNENKEEID